MPTGILAVGVDKYPGLGNTCGATGRETCNLNYAGADARRLVRTAESRLGAQAREGGHARLTNDAESSSDQPTAANILDALGRLRQAAENDKGRHLDWRPWSQRRTQLSLPGHQCRMGRPGLARLYVVPWQVLQEAIETAKGRRILFADTCHAAYNQRLGNAAYHANIIAYAAARFDQQAIEDPKLGHGLFTYAVVEGLDGSGAIGPSARFRPGSWPTTGQARR